MDTVAATLISSYVVDQYGTDWSTSTKMSIMALVTACVVSSLKFGLVVLKKIWSFIGKMGPKSFIVTESSDARTYYYFNKWVLANHAKQVNHAISKEYRGAVFTVPTSFDSFSVKYEEHTIQVKPKKGHEDTESKTDKYSSSTDFDIELCSETAPFAVLEQFAVKCAATQESTGKKATTNRLTIHTLFTGSGGDDDDGGRRRKKRKDAACIDWMTTSCVTNKCLANTVLSKTVETELVQTVIDFVNNESWYAAKGIPYKKNFLLHGPGGTGKTSVIKAIASHIEAEVFCISMSEITSDAVIQEAVARMRGIARSKFVILCLEDLDRSEMFDDDRYYNNENRSLLQGLLQVLDGINEPNAQITFITANDPTKIEKASDVLTRPGRIDKKVELTYCDEDQKMRMAMNHYDLKEGSDDELIQRLRKGLAKKQNVTPASLVQLFCNYPIPTELITLLENQSREAIDEVNRVMKIDEDEDCHKADYKAVRAQNRKTRMRRTLMRTKRDIKRLEKSISETTTQRVLKKIEAKTKQLTSLETRLSKIIETEKKEKARAKAKAAKNKNKIKTKKDSSTRAKRKPVKSQEASSDDTDCDFSGPEEDWGQEDVPHSLIPLEDD
uniref:Mitochondrial chaperone BCS1 n=1 Tax=Clandestinovirus TaxID=2831644 RepID=A0A8F8KLW7_9VIRU|nr:mitochondrial chaperone BCS1 [Clandestinovirus]